MKIEYNKKADSFYDDLSTLEKWCLNIAVFVAFASVFVWFFKLLFF